MVNKKIDLKTQRAKRESYSLPIAEQQQLEEIQNKLSGIKPFINKSEIVRIGIYKVSKLEEEEAKKILNKLGRLPVGKQKKDISNDQQTTSEITVTTEQWRIVKSLFPAKKNAEGRPQVNNREVLDSILYIFRFEIQRRKVPDGYISYATARRRLGEWRRLNLWRHICNALIDNSSKDHQIELQGVLLRTWLIETDRKINYPATS